MSDTRVAVVISHPIQHFCPQYSSWARTSGVVLRVFFASRHGLDAYHDVNFGRSVKWDGLELDFPHEFLEGAGGKAVDAQMDSPALDGQLQAFAPDLIVTYGYVQPLQRRAAAWARRHDKPTAMIADSELRSQRPWWKALAKRVVIPRLLRQPAMFLTVGDANESYYRQYGVTDERLIRASFPVDVLAFDRSLSNRSTVRAKLRTQLDVSQQGLVILMVGKLVSWKRQIDLVNFANSIRAERQDITVILVGSGPGETALKAATLRVGEGGVIYAGFVLPERLIEYYLAADIYAHCSEVEPHSLSISEAVYAGLPVVLSDRCGSYGPSDDVRHGLNGLVYHCGSQAGLNAALLVLADNNVLREDMAKASAKIGRFHQSLAHGDGLRQAITALRSAGRVP